MTTRAGRPAFVSDAIVVDEIGLESGIYGSYRLRSSYQPIFERRGALLFPFAVEALALPYLAGQPVPAEAFLAELPADDRLLVESVWRALHVRNHRNIGVDELQLFFNYDPQADADVEKFLTDLRFMAGRLAEVELDPKLLVCEIAQTAAPDTRLLVELAEEMRRRGLRLAVDDFGAGHSTLERVSLLKPEIVKIDGAWFRALCREPAAIKLFGSVVAGFQRGDAKVLVGGIEEPSHLGHALSAGADFFQGSFLASAAPVGTVFDETPLVIDEKLKLDPKVAPLFG